MTSRARREADGRRGEFIAAWYLRLSGWSIVAERVKTPRGEVDLIARRGRVLAFVEVKWRASAAARDQAIDATRLRRVGAAAAALAQRYAQPGDTVRVDVLLLCPWRWPRRITNGWQPGA